MNGTRMILAAWLASALLAPDGAGNAPGPGGGTDPKPDLVTSIQSTPLRSPNQNVSITVTVKKIGDAPAPMFSCDVIFKNGHAPRNVVRKVERKIRPLAAGDSFSYVLSIRVSLGLYEICATADRKRKVPESDETNNRSCLMIKGK